MSRIAIVGMACRYPDAASPRELWENAVAGRRAFRRLPDERMRLEDYWDADPATPDRFYARSAAVIEGYEFDRVAYRIAGSTYRSTDLTHWLALDVAAQALVDAGFPKAEGLPRERTGVVVGNTLTGEFTRANTMRLRWPYVRRTLAAALKEQGWEDERLAEFLEGYEAVYKSPFPDVNEDTLAGGLSNTIAGRICNYFDLNGGGFTVDGACSSSLLSVTTSAKALADGDLDVAIAGGVDLSIDPFEIIGFAKTGALAKSEFRLYDRHSNGFWPGEGCGMVVLMREEDAVAAGHRVYATIPGWGISSDGKGSMTRPEVSGYKLALRRAYERAGFGIETVGLFEGHGTGTAVGDATELTALSEARTEAGAAGPAAVGSIKAMIGHTKAAAGVAGLIKATMAVHEQVLPPTLGCHEPHEILTGGSAALRVTRKAEPWPSGVPTRAGVTAMGFGGINTHVVVEGAPPRRRPALPTRTRALASSLQDAELLLVDAATPGELAERLAEVAAFVARISYAQLSDLAATLQRGLRDLSCRAAVVASSPEEAERRLRRLLEALESGQTELASADGRAFLGRAERACRVGYLFPGQGSGRGTSGGALRRRFAEVEEIYRRAALPADGDMVATETAQPRIVTGSMAGLRALDLLGVSADVAVGHSLGELSALHWAGAMDEEALLRLAGARGRAMTEHSATGTMASLRAAPEVVAELVAGGPVVIAGYNGPEQTVVAGPVEAVEALGRAATEAGVVWTRLAVSHAFHSPLVAPAAEVLAGYLAEEDFDAVAGQVVSTVTGTKLRRDTDVPALLREQITAPVRFAEAVETAAKEVDLFIEVGPGRVLTGLAGVISGVPAVALDTDDESLAGLLKVVGAAYVAGVPVVPEELFHGRLTKPLEIGARFSFFASPAEQAPQVGVGAAVRRAEPARSADRPADGQAAENGTAEAAENGVDLLRRLAAERAELPLEMVSPDSRPLDELHLSSVTVMHIIDQAAQRLGVSAAMAPTNLATASLSELGRALEELAGKPQPQSAGTIAGTAAWARPFAVDLDEVPLAATGTTQESGSWQLYAPAEHPLAERLRRALEQEKVGSGVLVCLPSDAAEEHLEQALQGAKAALAGARGGRFVLVQDGRGAAGLAKTLRLEAPHLRVTVVHVPPLPEAVAWVVAEVAATTGFTEAYYDEQGVRRLPTLRALPPAQSRVEQPLGAADVLLVTGGGKGITAECALAVAVDSGAKLGVLGRSSPDDDEELAANLRKMAEAGVGVHYARADVSDPEQVRRAVGEVEAALGPVTAVLHGAGRNEPGMLAGLDLAAFADTFAPKVNGLRNVLSVVDPGRLRLLVTFGSIIGRAGLHGEAHYATANEWLADLTGEVARRHPDCRSICMEWSVWSDVGMGERLSVVDHLSREGITPVSPEQGVAIMRRLVTDPDTPPIVVISGRTGAIDTVRRDLPTLPLLRFVGKPLIRYHGVELVTEVELNSGTDPYLADHLLDGNLLFPAVFGLEAMAQAAHAVTGLGTVPVFEQAEFVRPIIVRPDSSATLRIAATVTEPDTVEVAIRCADSGFEVDHFRARVSLAGAVPPDGPPEQVAAGLPPVDLDPPAEMYGDVLFQGARFQRLRRYHRAAARHVDADVTVSGTRDWFAAFLPSDLLLSDPGMRDALMHGNQVCVPDATLLPTGIERLYPASGALADTQVRYCATERSREGDAYVYDIAARTATGEVVERWEGLRLQAVRKQDGRGPWLAPLLGSYLERSLEDLIGARVAVAVGPRQDGTEVTVGRALGRPADLAYDAAGRPEVEGTRIAVAEGAGVILSASTLGTVACEVAPVGGEPVPAAYAGVAERVGAARGEQPDTAAARVRAALACLERAGVAAGAPLEVAEPGQAAWAVFASGNLRVATLVTTLREVSDPVVFAILTEGRP
ncbi:type I polyketide synthase [Nonomuraea jiangxiensis]|uniref:Enediyne polyketide synthase n=1 Tax=Nonomuraea jiangxiensis TaxID=633440 RepID=A0A1G8IH26_9ACTN|nr:type I polyketide synthase [Nonomuraea jiangxiensis]SDI18061.1 enediyne polyketide synthase [Nonomuraea jiangxiensis]